MIHISYLLSYLRPVEERLAPFTCQCSACSLTVRIEPTTRTRHGRTRNGGPRRVPC